MSEKKYWDKFYLEAAGSFEWLVDYNDVKEHINYTLLENYQQHKDYCLLDLGCGTSHFAVDLINDKSPTVNSSICCFLTDFSINCLVYQSNIYRPEVPNVYRPANYWCVLADSQRIPLVDGSIDTIFDKGTTDSVLKNPISGKYEAGNILKECLRLVKSSGAIYQITDEDPDLRLSLLDNYRIETSFDVGYKSIFTVRSCHKEYFVYEIKKA